MRFKRHNGLTFLYNILLISFAMIAIGLIWTVTNSGFSTTQAVKETLESAMTQQSNSLLVIGKMTGTANVTNNKVTSTATPLTATVNGIIDMTTDNVKVTYKLIKDGSHTITYDNIYTGSLHEDSYNSLSAALAAAKEKGLIKVNPQVDIEKPDTTTAFLYWIINQDYDENIQGNEIASLVLVYADKDRPSTGEYLQIQAIEKEEVLLNLERNVPNISSSILDFGGKVNDKQN